ncbi:MAG TPA: phosphoadenylyl-sulfate reductase [Phycisphaerae bacterium]|nr:phosphoadenylyl-sulfate reductase [Phycisphaerae bacterium]
MSMNQIDKFLSATANFNAEEILAWASTQFGSRIALASSFGAEDQVMTDMIASQNLPIAIFTLDTGRLPQETYDLIDATRQRYNLDIEVLFPDPADVEEMVRQCGVNCFRKSVELRKTCCNVRKVKPLGRRVNAKTLDAWVTGLRREQALMRSGAQAVQWDQANGLVKINPLVDWTDQQVWSYIRKHDVAYNALHDRGYPSIGCLPCTRAVKPGEHPRAGRWWWEQPEQKECGLHVVNGELVRKKTDSE